uniref:Endosulphine n=1 Tax=Kalanchoe fedtschenkoi TaxID=63787 RepID=A0A7N0T1X2_KALFE
MAEYNRASAGAGAAREDSYVSTRGQSQDHGRAFFDSADWALCKQGAGVQKSTVAVESLSPKLKRTPHPKLPPRMPACTSGGDCDGE